MAIYDIHDLIYVPPDFTSDPPPGVHPERDFLDRDALRNGFGGGWGFWPGFSPPWYSPADTIALARYFGGVNPWADRGPRYSADKQREIIDMIRAFAGAQSEGPTGMILVPGQVGEEPPAPPAPAPRTERAPPAPPAMAPPTPPPLPPGR